MKPLPVLIACLTAAAATSAGVSLLLRPTAPPAEETRAVSPDLWSDLSETLESMQVEQARLADALRDLEMRSASADLDRIGMGDVDAAVARYFESAAGDEAATEALPDALAAPTEPKRTAREDFEALVAGDWDGEAMQEIWQRAREEGRVDELLAMFEAYAEEDPNDPERRIDLGQAYLEKIQDVGNGPLAGKYATLADEAFDAALEIDPQHWEARFNKAVALSFWPPIFNRQAVAIQEFETLVAQQANLPNSPNHAQTHLLLGNLYQQQGDRDKAIEAWRQGASLYPDFEELRRQLELAGAQ